MSSWRETAKKTCDVCGRSFGPRADERPSVWATRTKCSVPCVQRARSIKSWERRPRRTCPICRDEFRSAQPRDAVATCGKAECKQRYRHEIAAPKVAAKARAAYAAGTRPRITGISPRELLLWPTLKDAGWSWRLRWWDAWGCFEIDFTLPLRLLAVEVDGPEHLTGSRKRRDRARDAELERRGWRIMRISNADVDASPEDVLRRIDEFVLLSS